MENQDNQNIESEVQATTTTLKEDLMAAFGVNNQQEQDLSENEGDNVVDDTKEEAEEAEEAREEAEEDKKIEDDLPIFKAPSNWNKAEKEHFEKLPDELELEDGTVVQLKEILSKYDKSRQADYTRKTKEISELRNELNPLKELIEPYKDNFKRMGIEPANYMQQLINLDIFFT